MPSEPAVCMEISRYSGGETGLLIPSTIGTSESHEERTKALTAWRQKRGALQGTMRMELDLLETVTGGGAMIGSPGEGPMTKPIWYTPR